MSFEVALHFILSSIFNIHRFYILFLVAWIFAQDIMCKIAKCIIYNYISVFDVRVMLKLLDSTVSCFYIWFLLDLKRWLYVSIFIRKIIVMTRPNYVFIHWRLLCMLLTHRYNSASGRQNNRLLLYEFNAA